MQQGSAGAEAVVQGPWRWTAVHAPRLPEIGSRSDGFVHRAWGWQAVPVSRLHDFRKVWHGLLLVARWRCQEDPVWYADNLRATMFGWRVHWCVTASVVDLRLLVLRVGPLLLCFEGSESNTRETRKGKPLQW